MNFSYTNKILIILLPFILLFSDTYFLICEGYAIWMIDSDLSCTRRMVEEEVIMNSLVVSYKDSKYKFALDVYRKTLGEWSKANVVSEDGGRLGIAKYLPGEDVRIGISMPEEFLEKRAPHDVQFVMEILNSSEDAKFVEGTIGCDGKRAAGYSFGDANDIILRFTGNSPIVQVNAGWAIGKEAVKMSQPLYFINIESNYESIREGLILGSGTSGDSDEL